MRQSPCFGDPNLRRRIQYLVPVNELPVPVPPPGSATYLPVDDSTQLFSVLRTPERLPVTSEEAQASRTPRAHSKKSDALKNQKEKNLEVIDISTKIEVSTGTESRH